MIELGRPRYEEVIFAKVREDRRRIEQMLRRDEEMLERCRAKPDRIVESMRIRNELLAAMQQPILA